MSDLLKLAERVESGEKPIGIAETGDIFEDIYQTLYPSLEDKKDAGWGDDLREALTEYSLDAAKALHDAVLPNWEWGIDHLNGERDVYVRKDRTLIEVHMKGGISDVAAWVAAILRAKASEDDQ